MLKNRSTAPRFVSIRWKILLPLSIVMLVITMLGAYSAASGLGLGVEVSQTNILLASSRSAADRMAELYERQRSEAQRIAYTAGVPEAVAGGRSMMLAEPLESLARIGTLDSVVLTDSRGLEVIGLQRVETSEGIDYAVSSGTNLLGETILEAVLVDGFIGATSIMRTSEGLVLYTAVPLNNDNALVGTVMVGFRMERILSDLRASGSAELALYGSDSALLQTTLPTRDTLLESLTISPELYEQGVRASVQVPVQPLVFDSIPYQAAYIPFHYGPNTLGVIGVFMPDNVPFAMAIGRQLTSLSLAALAGAVVVVVFAGLHHILGRAVRIERTARALAAGDSTARTGMAAHDEISAIGQALDHYADGVQARQDELRGTLRRQRRETAHLMAILEALPDGVIVQDLDGKIILMNDPARKMLGTQRSLRHADLQGLTGLVTDVLGPALAPGLYAVGDPQRLDLDGRMLSAQAAVLLNVTGSRVGTVIALHDMTEQVRRDQAREELVTRLEKDIQAPLGQLAQMRVTSPTRPIHEFAREITRHAVALQKMVVEMRELADTSAQRVQQEQRQISLDALVWSIANEWRQVAMASNLSLHVMIERRGLYVLGDERRLRWAVGNLLDNAIKYTPPGGALTLEVRGASETHAHLRVRDSGVGIDVEELPNVFTRFFRGTPTTPDGRVLRVPGTGQGLALTKQTIEAYGGGVQIKSTLGKGTAVYFTLPLTAPVSIEIPGSKLMSFTDEEMEGETVLLEQNLPKKH